MPARDADLPQEHYAATLELPFGRFGIRLGRDAISELVFLPPDTPLLPPRAPLAAQAAEQIAAWLENPDSPFSLPLEPRGTPFQQRVWRAIAAIPRGKVCTYGALSKQLASAARAVGQACGANPFPIVIPCHRVVSSTGLGGFAGAIDGYLMDAKRWLLAFESRQ